MDTRLSSHQKRGLHLCVRARPSAEYTNLEYGTPIPQTTEEVRRNVVNRVENLTGLRVAEVNITVNDVQFPEERPQLERQQEVERTAREQERRA